MLFEYTLALLYISPFASALISRSVRCPDGKTIASNAACCAFYSLAQDLQSNVFHNQCDDEAHEVLRLTFHDAIGFSQTGQFQGTGADGSMITFESIETNYAANQALADAVDLLKPLLGRHNVTPGDLIQFAGAVGITNCPGAPRLQFLAGRPVATAPASDGTVPGPQQSVDDILTRMNDAGFTSNDLVHLMASHTVARTNVDKAKPRLALDTTPNVFDTQFFLETLLAGTGWPGTPNSFGEVESPLPQQGEFRFQSDFALARDSRTACEWQSMVNNQVLMMSNFQKAMAKMAVTGQNTKKLIDCSDAVPQPRILWNPFISFPAGKTKQDLQQSCKAPFPVLATDRGQPTQIPSN